MHVHVASFFTLPAILTIAFGLAPEDNTDWSKWAFKDLLPLSLFGGFSFGDSGDKTNYMGFSDLVWENSGATVVATAVVWALYGGLFVLGKAFGKGEKLMTAMMWARYFMVTVQLCLAPGMWYSAVYALRSASMTSQGSSINVCISIFIAFYLLAFLSLIFILSSQISPINHINEEEILEKLSADDNLSENEKKSRTYENSMLNFDLRNNL